MKTSVNMVRKMGNFEVVQRTKDGMFNATELLKQWNKYSGMKKEIKDFFENKSTKEFIQTIESEDSANRGNSPYLKTRGKYGGTWMHPYLFIDFAMWLNPKFKYKVIQFVHDQLIEQRHLAGDMYKTLSKAASQLPGVNYSQLAKGLNYIVFGRHESGILRQQASREQLNELSEIQNKLAFAVDMGYIKTFDGLLEEMRKIWHYRNIKF